MKKLILILLLTLSACKNLETAIGDIAPPAKAEKGDGYIFFDYLSYEKNLVITENDQLKFVLKVKKNDVEKVQIIFNKKTYNMNSIGVIGEFEYFEGKVKKVEESKLYFKVTDGELNYYFGTKGSLKEKEIIPIEYIEEKETTRNFDTKLWYRVYIDSFYNGNKNNDPIFNEYGPESFFTPDTKLASEKNKRDLIKGWETNSSKKILGKFELNTWNDDFNSTLSWENKARKIYGNSIVAAKRYGGDLQGLEAKEDYLKNMSTEILWISSPFYSFSGSKNDVIDYRHISPDYGVLEDSDGISEYNKLQMNSSEKNNLNETLDINSWENTDSDNYFRDLLLKLKNKNIKVVSDINLDYVSNRFFAFEDVIKNGKDSVYWDWFEIKDSVEEVYYGGTATIGVESKDGYLYRKSFIKILPEYSQNEKAELFNWNKENMGYTSLGGQKNLVKLNLKNEQLKKYLIDASKKWLKLGLSGYVIRVRAGENEEFYKMFEKEINQENQYIIKFDLVDAKKTSIELEKVLNYDLAETLYRFLGDNRSTYTGEDMYTNLYILNRNRENLNFIEGIDIDRLNSNFINGNREFDSGNEEDGSYLGIRPDLLDVNDLGKYKLAILIQFILSGDQSIYYGSEKYMWGGDVPHNRKAMIWEEYFPYIDETDDLEKYADKKTILDTKIVYDEAEGKIRYKINIDKNFEDFYRNIIKIKKDYKEIFVKGNIEKINTGENFLVFSKGYGNNTIIFAINKGSKEEKMIIDIGKGKDLIDLTNGTKRDILKGKAEIAIPPFGYLIYKK